MSTSDNPQLPKEPLDPQYGARGTPRGKSTVKRGVGPSEGPIRDRVFDSLVSAGNRHTDTSCESSANGQRSSSPASSGSRGVSHSPSEYHRPGKYQTQHNSRAGKGFIPSNDRYYTRPFGKQPKEIVQRRIESKKSAMLELLEKGQVENYKRPEEDQAASSLKKGDIISVVTHTRFCTPTVMSNKEAVSYAGVFGAVQSKFRKMIVLERYAEHFACAPIFTYGGTGGAGRGDLEDELIPIRDRVNYTQEEVQDLHMQIIFCDMRQGFTGNFVDGQSVVKVSERESVHVAEKVSLEGSIEPTAAALLSLKYMWALARANKC